ncbi:MAG: hypothetical protein HFE33_05320 [Clostridia bacterium]|nr:hypothetical protein [Clostridia bacterium]
MNEIEEIAEQRRIARILCQDEKGKCLHNATSCESHIECAFTILAQKLLNAGYGDVKQAVREFADKLIDELCDHCIDNKNVNLHLYDIVQIVKKHRKEVCGE